MTRFGSRSSNSSYFTLKWHQKQSQKGKNFSWGSMTLLAGALHALYYASGSSAHQNLPFQNSRSPNLLSDKARVQPKHENNWVHSSFPSMHLQLAATLDLFPTLVKLVEAHLPNVTIDGIDMSPILFGDGKVLRMLITVSYYSLEDSSSL